MTEHNDNQIIVSISCITYNHAPYIRQCLDGFMMQQTDFAYEVLIHDDASTDGTTEIIKEYETKYPDIIKPIYEEENQWVKGRKGSAVFNFPRAKGKYIALCEGDDYWTDPLKLQKQVDFLEDNHNYVMCSHNYDYYYQNTGCLDKVKEDNDQIYSFEYLIKGGWLFHPLTVVFRRSAMSLTQLNAYSNMMDAVLFYHLLQRGDGYYMGRNMAVYRIHNGGVWSGIDRAHRLLTEYKARLAIYDVDKSEPAAQFLLTQFTKESSRKWLLKQYQMIIRVLLIINKHFGLKLTMKIIFDKMILGKNYRYSD